MVTVGARSGMQVETAAVAALCEALPGLPPLWRARLRASRHLVATVLRLPGRAPRAAAASLWDGRGCSVSWLVSVWQLATAEGGCRQLSMPHPLCTSVQICVLSTALSWFATRQIAQDCEIHAERLSCCIAP